MELYDLRVNHRTAPLGIDCPQPRFSWKIKSSSKNVMQRAYRIVAVCGDECLWDSGIVESCETHDIYYKGRKLHSRQQILWSVEVTTTDGRALASATFEMGLLDREDWRGKFIEPESVDADIMQPVPVPYLRRVFIVEKKLKRARIYHTAHGAYRFWINGERGSDRVFAPGDTNYLVRLQYQVDDITDILKPGENIWAIHLGDGWWRGGCGAGGTRCTYGRRVHYMGQIELTYEDGSMAIIPTDETFKSGFGGIREADPKIGTVYDAAMEPVGWMACGFDDSFWNNVHLAPENMQRYDVLLAESGEPVKEMEELAGTPFRDGNNDLVVDFGQNIAGYVRLKLRGLKKNQQIRLEHCEMLHDGCFDDSNVFIKETSNYDRFQTVIYTADRAEDEFCPEFSIFGFRYCKITGYDGPILPGDFTAIAVYTALEETFRFECSNPLLNRLVENSMWSQKGNFCDVPTDCPTRERSAWCGDAQVYAKTAAELMDVYTFFEKWMVDVASEQTKDGSIPSIAPSNGFHNDDCREAFIERMSKDPSKAGMLMMMGGKDDEENEDRPDGSVGWGDAAVIIPYKMYMAYGDRAIVERQYESARGWVKHMIRRAKKKNPLYLEEAWNKNVDENGQPDADFIWDAGFHWGEWSEPGFVMRFFPPGFIEGKMEKGEPAVATAYLSYSCGLMAKLAAWMGNTHDAEYYQAISEKVAGLYEKYLIEDDGTVRFVDAGRQAPYARVIKFGLAKGEKLEKVKQKLLEMIVKAKYHLNTGFLTTPFLLNVLADCGYTDAAYKVLEQTGNPSWLYPITRGATTIYESWDGANLFFGSFNHYSYGAVCDYLFSYAAGIRINEQFPGYSRFTLKPVPGGTLSYAKAAFESIHGTIRSSWRKAGDNYIFDFVIPANTQADIELPDGTQYHVGSGKYSYCI